MSHNNLTKQIFLLLQGYRVDPVVDLYTRALGWYPSLKSKTFHNKTPQEIFGWKFGVEVEVFCVGLPLAMEKHLQNGTQMLQCYPLDSNLLFPVQPNSLELWILFRHCANTNRFWRFAWIVPVVKFLSQFETLGTDCTTFYTCSCQCSRSKQKTTGPSPKQNSVSGSAPVHPNMCTSRLLGQIHARSTKWVKGDLCHDFHDSRTSK